jgi:hypothetical protein
MKTLALIGMKSRQIRQGIIIRNQTVEVSDDEASSLFSQNTKDSDGSDLTIWQKVTT